MPATPYNNRDLLAAYFARFGTSTDKKGALSTQPNNSDLASVNAYVFQFTRFPTIPFFTQSVILPDVTAGFVMQPTNQAIDLPRTGDKIVFGDFNVSFMLDEDMTTQRTLLEWLVASVQDKVNEMSDFSIFQLTNQKNPNNIIRFYNSFPVSMSSVQLDSKEGPERALTIDVLIKYSHYEIKRYGEQ